MSGHKILRFPSSDSRLKDIFSKELKISKVLAQVLINRGMKNTDEAADFLDIDLRRLLDPYQFRDMQKAVYLINEALRNKARVMIFGDYDVDGVTSLALLKATLSKIGIDTVHYLPHRVKEGYGLSKDILELVRQRGARLLITVDCGTNSHEQIKELRRHNIDVIVTDHHEPLGRQPSCASAIINPKLKDSMYKYRDLAGVGVAYKLCQALTGQHLFDDLDLVSLGTIADVVPLTGENRIIAKEGLSRISRTKKAGIRALMENSGIQDKKMTPTFISYILGPRINASGRIDTAEVALSLLMSRERDEAEQFVKVVESHNRQRQKIENIILEEAQDLIDKEINFKEHKVIVVAKEDWHHGVLGIVASKLADRFYRPTILISKSSGLCKGSGRSIKDFHLFQALAACGEFLEAFGGHSHAVGLVIAKDNIGDFKDRINLVAKESLRFEDLLPSLDIDMEISLSDINDGLITEMERLEPFGRGNPEPLFYTRGLRLKSNPQVLGKDTLKFWVTDGGVTYQAIGFGMASLQESLSKADSFDLAYNPRWDNWLGQESILLEIADIFFK